jgi:hypothetical protein
MRRAMIVFGLTLGSFTMDGMALPMQAETDVFNLPLLSVTRRSDYAFAVAPDGLYRASLDTKKWEKLKTAPEMPLDGRFAKLPDRSPLVLYVALKSIIGSKNKPLPPGLRYGIYLSRDHGATWELASERDNYGDTLLMPDGMLYAFTGADGINGGHKFLQSPDMGKSWKDITGKAFGNFQSIQRDPDHPGLVRIHSWAIREYIFVAKDDKYEWECFQSEVPVSGRRPSEDFFSRDSASSNRYHFYSATLSNYFSYDFGNQVQVQAFEAVPRKPRYEFARGAQISVPIRVVFHWDQASMMAQWRKAEAEGRSSPKPSEPNEKLAVQPDGLDFWVVRVETAETQTVKSLANYKRVTTTERSPDGSTYTRSQQVPAEHQTFNLSPSTPYEKVLDLGKYSDFSKPGEYHVQVIYSSGGSADRKKDEWEGTFTGPVFTVVIGN